MAIVKRPIWLSELKEKAKKAPCSDEIIKLAEAELSQGNILLALDQLTTLPSETYYICQFKYFSKTRPDGLKKGKNKFYDEEILSFSDNRGGVEVRFNCDREVCDAPDR